MSAKAEYMEILNAKFANGLRHVAFVTSGLACATSPDAGYAELLRMEKAPDMPDPEVLGRFSPGC